MRGTLDPGLMKYKVGRGKELSVVGHVSHFITKTVL